MAIDQLTDRVPDSTAIRASRVAALDGLRGMVIISVVLNHAVGQLWPRGRLYDIPVLNGVLGAGAVTVFFVVGGFIVTDGLLREQGNGRLDAWRFYLRRIVRLGGQLAALCVAVAIAEQFDRVPPDGDTLTANVLHVMTHTFNVLIDKDFFTVDPVFGHLWFLSVQQQCYLVLPLMLALLGRRRWVLIGVMVALMVAVYIERQNVLDDRGWVVASSLTTTRADGLLWGVALAAALPWLRRLRGWGHVLWISGLVLLALKLALPELPNYSYLTAWSIPFTLVAGVVVAAVWLLPARTRTSRFLEMEVLRRLGKASLAIFVWHLPIFIIVARHTGGWSWPERTLVAFSVLTAVVWASERWIDEPVRRLLASHPVFRIRREPAA